MDTEVKVEITDPETGEKFSGTVTELFRLYNMEKQQGDRNRSWLLEERDKTMWLERKCEFLSTLLQFEKGHTGLVDLLRIVGL